MFHAYVINLDTAPERLARAKRCLDEAGIDGTRIRAIRGADIVLPIPELSHLGYILQQGRRPIIAEVGCYLSHLKALRQFIKDGHPFGLILEDDAAFLPELADIIKAALRYHAFWDILRLSSVNSDRYLPLAKLGDPHSLGIALTREKGAGAYVVSRKAAAVMLKRYLPMKLPYDHRFDLEWLDGMKALGVSPFPVTQKGFKSQIQHKVRSHYLPAYLRYWTVFPCRAFWESTRFLARSSRYLYYRFFGMHPLTTADQSTKKACAVPQRHLRSTST